MTHPSNSIVQVVLWGHKLNTHSHSYIHFAFKRAYDHLGYKTLWLDDRDDISQLNLSNSLFITEGQVDKRIPILENCWYILHNCDPKKYENFFKSKHAYFLQVYTHDCLERKEPSLDKCIHYCLGDKPVIYMPWATDLLPHEIDALRSSKTENGEKKGCIFYGSVSGGYYGNDPEIQAFRNRCLSRGIPFNRAGNCNLTMDQTIDVIRKAEIAPAIQGKWQVDKGYIPCRIFKNISYGAVGITNSKTVNDLFDGKLIYSPNCEELVDLSLDTVVDDKTKNELIDLVRDKHTYINRVKLLFDFFKMI